MGKPKKQERKERKYNWGNLILELFVVFLGVTAGFLLNNWTSNQDEHALEQKYINGFYEDVVQNISVLEESTIGDSLWLIRTGYFMEQLANGTLNTDSAAIGVSLVVEVSKFTARQGTYEDITNSGNLSIISDFDLKKGIVDYQESYKGVQFMDDFFYEFAGEYVTPFVMREFNLVQGELKNPEMSSSVAYSNMFAGCVSMRSQRFQVYKEFLEESYSFKKQLEATNRIDIN
ncbi:MAG: hypothetical protein QNK23_16625 [Crocinitomicaceae bacterium]|nr:hypothetical protein [Crocinitomicaceae bacterium]